VIPFVKTADTHPPKALAESSDGWQHSSFVTQH